MNNLSKPSLAARIINAITPRRLDVPLQSAAVIREEVAAANGLVLDVGCGERHIGEGVIRTDLAFFPSLDLVSNACQLPFRDGTFALVVCSEVLEHVPDWHLARDEILRVTRPGGKILVDVPFIYPYHAHPEEAGHDYTRWTPRGLRHLFKGCEVLKEGMVVGHGSVLALLLREFIARMFLTKHHTVGYYVVYAWLSWILYPLTWLDGWLDKKPRANVIGGAYYLVARKPAV